MGRFVEVLANVGKQFLSGTLPTARDVHDILGIDDESRGEGVQGYRLQVAHLRFATDG